MTSHGRQDAWNGSLGVFEFTIDSITLQRTDRGGLLYVRIAGDYWGMPNRHEGSEAIRMIIAAALASPYAPALAVICDLSGLVYSGGDQLLGWRHLLPVHKGKPTPFAIVSSDANRARIASLIAYEDDDSLADVLRPSVDDAVSYLERRLSSGG